jgi:hypothetical protein
MKFLAIPILVIGISAPALAAPPGPRDPDWPCFAIKVPTLSLAEVWTGPPVDSYFGRWSQDTDVSDLVDRVVQRRLPIDQARTAIADFAAKAGGPKKEKLLAVMAGVFERLDAERSSVLVGLDRYGRRQKELAHQVRSDAEALRVRQSAATPDPQAITQLIDKVTWEARVFEDRRQSVSTACDIPTVIEQRLYALAQAIQQALG